MGDQKVSGEEAVRRVVQQISDLWLRKQYDEIGELVSEHVVIAPPGFEGRIHGRDAYVQSYRDYDEAATTHEFTPGKPEIDIMGDVAVAVCPFFIVYELDGATYRDNGHDVLVLSKTTGTWRVVWRTLQTEPTV